MASPQGLTINIYAGSPPIPITNIKPTMKRASKSKSIKSKRKPVRVDKSVARGDGLDVELMNRDNMADDEKMDLEQRVVLFVRDMLKKKKSTILRNFLDKGKHHFDRELKKGISEEISASKKGM